MNRFLLLIAAVAVLSACGGGEEKGGETVEEDPYANVDREQFMVDFDELNNRINSNLATPNEKDLKSAITMYQDYANLFPDNEDVADYLLKASDFCIATRQPEKAVKILDRIIAEHPDYERMQSVMISRANHLDMEMRDTARAREAYEEFIAAYPNTKDAEDAQARLDYLELDLDALGDLFMQQLEEGKADTVAL